MTKHDSSFLPGNCSKQEQKQIYTKDYPYFCGKIRNMNTHPLHIIHEDTFLAGSGRLDTYHNHLAKFGNAAVFFCRRGKARFIINLKEYEVEENSQILLLPNSILNITQASEDFLVSYFSFSANLLREVSVRLEPSFFGFLNRNPHCNLPAENTRVLNGLMCATEALYNDRENRFRSLMVRNILQNFLLEVYDKTHRLFAGLPQEGSCRRDELFKGFIELIHQHCNEQRDVTFYAGKLCITSRYLSSIVQDITHHTAKFIIDKHVMLEIKALLQSTDLSLQEISNQLNFPDQSFFGRYFKKHTGLSPSDYRKSFTPFPEGSKQAPSV